MIPVLAPYTLGAAGVSFFFVLSGFVLTWSFSDRDRHIREQPTIP